MKTKVYYIFYDSSENLREDAKKQRDLGRELLTFAAKREYGYHICPEDIIKASTGKPYIRDNPFFFNISHCSGVVCCALSKSKVGVDVETLARKNHLRLIERVCTKKEVNHILSSENSDMMFMKYWTLKESLIKYDGRGLSYGLKNAEFAFTDERPYCVTRLNEPEVETLNGNKTEDKGSGLMLYELLFSQFEIQDDPCKVQNPDDNLPCINLSREGVQAGWPSVAGCGHSNAKSEQPKKSYGCPAENVQNELIQSTGDGQNRDWVLTSSGVGDYIQAPHNGLRADDSQEQEIVCGVPPNSRVNDFRITDREAAQIKIDETVCVHGDLKWARFVLSVCSEDDGVELIRVSKAK